MNSKTHSFLNSLNRNILYYKTYANFWSVEIFRILSHLYSGIVCDLSDSQLDKVLLGYIHSRKLLSFVIVTVREKLFILIDLAQGYLYYADVGFGIEGSLILSFLPETIVATKKDTKNVGEKFLYTLCL